MEERVIVLRAPPLVVLASTAVLALVIIIIRVVEGVRRERSCVDGGAEGFGAHLTARRGLLVYKAVLDFFVADLAVGVAGVVAKRDTLSRGASCRVGNCEHGDDSAEDSRCGPCASSSDEGIAVPVVRLHADG